MFPEAIEIYMLKALFLGPERILIRSDPIYIVILAIDIQAHASDPNLET